MLELRRVAKLTVLAVASGLCLGITNIDPGFKYCWGENIGWLNWRDANGGSEGVRVHKTFLSGFAWAENVGFINLGDGNPANGTAYANVDGTDFGVNIDPVTGDLYGLAWGENIGWVNFDTRATLGGSNQQGRMDLAANRFRGYAWGENVGWISLDNAARFVAFVPASCGDPFADADADGDVDQVDFAVIQACFSGSGRPAPAGCECFDRPEIGFPRGDNDVDGDDMQAFADCASGPGIPADPACDEEACCFADGNCADAHPATCAQQGGTARGPGTRCATTQCPSP